MASLPTALRSICWTILLACATSPVLQAAEPESYDQQVLADSPVFYCGFQGQPTAVSAGSASLKPKQVGRVRSGNGPGRHRYPLFRKGRNAAEWAEHGYLVVDDPGENSPLDFDLGDAITIEAWVQVKSLGEGQHTYIVGKGRTGNPGVARDNQNYAVRLTGTSGRGRLSFLFRSRGPQAEFHRWTANEGISTAGWHHIAVTYEFGRPDSLHGYLDGREVTGDWDMGGKTAKAPVVDNDQLWIGSSVGGNPRVTFQGSMTGLAIHRKALAAETMAGRFAKVNNFDWRREFEAVEPGQVQVQVYDGVGGHLTDLDEPLESLRASYLDEAFAVAALPTNYLPGGQIGPLANPQCVRLMGRFPCSTEQSWELLLRAKSGSRLWIDGKLIVETPNMKRNSSGHEQVPELAEAEGQLAALPAGHQERRVLWNAEPGEHKIVWDVLVGGKGVRMELGEAYLGLRPAQSDEVFRLWGATGPQAPITEPVRTALLERLAQQATVRDTVRRRAAAASEDSYWRQRHEQAAEVAASLKPTPPRPVPGFPAHNVVDHFLNAKLQAAGISPTELTTPSEFVRRAHLDVTGVIPTLAETQAFLADSVEGRRERLIRRLLQDPGWADHWVAYWQDVLAENPGILKPKLNNTGPFRYWIHESFVDNMPFDRFVTELIRMRGSVYEGGAAGFSLATQNDVPMAAKAHVVATAFLGVEMKCARCHDAPYHPYKQEQLMSLAAFLQRKPVKLPASSTVPVEPGGRVPLVKISLEPGASIAPQWPFPQWVTRQQVAPALPRGADLRDELAALITSPHNTRFAEVVVNRMWQRYFGRGLAPGLGDWHQRPPRHPELLRYLAAELIGSGYDLKHVAQLMLNSHAYQRRPSGELAAQSLELFAAPARRRMSAEQLLDSLLVSAGKPMDTEALSLDPEGRRPANSFLNLGVPTRAWEFTSLSNERDRPALALPAAQSMIDLLVAFGWRDSRPNPISVRPEEPTMLQPLALANGIAGLKATRLSDDHSITELALADVPLQRLVRDICLQLLSREPTAEETQQFVALLSPGYESRVVPDAVKRPRRRLRNPVSWSNHLHHRATTIKLELERQVREGDPPTERLQADWRERLEDVVWALINSPEFVFVP